MTREEGDKLKKAFDDFADGYSWHDGFYKAVAVKAIISDFVRECEVKEAKSKQAEHEAEFKKKVDEHYAQALAEVKIRSIQERTDRLSASILSQLDGIYHDTRELIKGQNSSNKLLEHLQWLPAIAITVIAIQFIVIFFH